MITKSMSIVSAALLNKNTFVVESFLIAPLINFWIRHRLQYIMYDEYA